MQARVTTALIYPAILLVMVFGLLVFLSGYVVPVIKPLLQQHHRPLPLTTQILFRLGDLVRGFAWTVLPAAAAAIGAVIWWRRSERRRGAMDAWMLRMPILGKLWLKSLVARFAMTFSTLLRTGVPALEALEVLEGVVPNAAFAEEIGRIRRDVIEGKEISARMQASAIFPPMVGYMVAVGERSGSLADVLEHVSEAYEQEVDVTSKRLLAALEPVLVLLMAGVVGFIATSLMVTILELSHI
jgi:type II secretory pathway component PulF